MNKLDEFELVRLRHRICREKVRRHRTRRRGGFCLFSAPPNLWVVSKFIAFDIDLALVDSQHSTDGESGWMESKWKI